MPSNDIRGLLKDYLTLSPACLRRHPSICQFYGAFEDATFIYIVMELCSRGDLMEMLVGEYGVGKLSEERAVQMVMVPLLSALQACHALGVVHRCARVSHRVKSLSLHLY